MPLHYKFKKRNEKKAKKIHSDNSSSSDSSAETSKVPLQKSKADSDAIRSKNTLFIGPIRSCFVVKSNEKNDEFQDSSKSCKGFGFVHFALPEDAVKAMKDLRKEKFGNRSLKMELAVRKGIVKNSKDVIETLKPKKKNGKMLKPPKDTPANADRLIVNDNEESHDIVTTTEAKKKRPRMTEAPSDPEPKCIKLSKQNKEKVHENVQNVASSAELVEENIEATVFLRNLDFDTTESDIIAELQCFGEIKYCKIVRDKISKASKGMAFVNFINKADALNCLEKAKSDNLGMKNSLIQDDSNENGVYINNRRIFVLPAVSKNELPSIKERNSADALKNDKRNIYLGELSKIKPSDENAMSKSDKEKREKSIAERKNTLKNPNFFISTTRLSVRNIPVSIDEKKLKSIITTISKTIGKKIPIKQIKILRSKDRIEAATGKFRSKGFGFVECANHESALLLLKELNNNAEVFTYNNRPIVEFAIENSAIVSKRKERNATTKSKKDK